MRVIDFHTHVFADALAPRAIAALSATAGIPPRTDGTVGSLLRHLDGWGVDAAVLLPVATKPSQQRTINDWVLSVRSERLIPFGTVHPDAEDAVAELERIRAAGFKGIKLHPDYQGFMVDDARVFPIYEACRALGLIVVLHTGLDAISPELIHAIPDASARVVRRFPGLRLVLAHLGGYMQWDEVERHLVGAPVYFDTAFTAGEISDEQALRIIRAHGADKVLFASDCPWHAPTEELAMLNRLPLTDGERAAILHGNAERLLNL